MTIREQVRQEMEVMENYRAFRTQQFNILRKQEKSMDEKPLKVKELIAKLEKCDPEAEVKIAVYTYYTSGPQYWCRPFGEHLNRFVDGRVGIKISLPNHVYTGFRQKDAERSEAYAEFMAEQGAERKEALERHKSSRRDK